MKLISSVLISAMNFLGSAEKMDVQSWIEAPIFQFRRSNFEIRS